MSSNKKELRLNTCQSRALEALRGQTNVFLTGGAGSGKSFLIRHFLKEVDYPILASTGAAAILLGGRTFHSFFGLGILEGGVEKTVEKAMSNKRLMKRMKETTGVIIDEISMISGTALKAAERIARAGKKVGAPWGGIRIITVGDFSQLPPVTRFQDAKDWAFLDPVWHESEFAPLVLKTIERTQDREFLEVLNRVRHGVVDRHVTEFLNERRKPPSDDFDGTRMFPLRSTTEQYNLRQLEKLSGKAQIFLTEYSGDKKAIEDLKKNAPVPEAIQLKEGALIMIRQNDPIGRWVNGSLGRIESMDDEVLEIELLNGNSIELERATFHILDSNGERAASATNFPVSLAYATTIHKAQGTTLDKMMVDLKSLWEPGHAYVALSRVRTPQGLSIEAWEPRSIRTDPHVMSFHRSIGAEPDELTDESIEEMTDELTDELI